MQNVKTKIEGQTLTITIDLNADKTPSKSGKTMVLASTRGNVNLKEAGVVLGLNCYTAR